MRFRICLISFLVMIFCVLAFGKNRDPKIAKQHSQRPSDYAQYLVIPGAEKAGSEQCAACHKDAARDARHSFHALQGVQCEDCHGAGSLHVQGGGDTSKIINFKTAKAEVASGVCLSCHAGGEQVRNWFAGTHQAQDVKCSGCHTLHGEKTTLESRRQMNDNCLQCHQKQAAEGDLPYHHPIREAKMSCVDCHDAHGGKAGNNLKLANVNQLCFNCHAEFQGPFTYQHAPVNESCMKCHTPHGSPNRNLLVVSQPALCLQCHAAHHNGANLPLVDRCTNCHTSIHGTDTASATGGSVFIDK